MAPTIAGGGLRGRNARNCGLRASTRRNWARKAKVIAVDIARLADARFRQLGRYTARFFQGDQSRSALRAP